MAQYLERSHERAFSAVVWADQHRQPIGRFDDRVPMRHEVNKLNPFNHLCAVAGALEKDLL